MIGGRHSTYMVIERQTIKRLQEQVNELLGQGWMLVGGIAIMHVGDGYATYTQAMIKGAD